MVEMETVEYLEPYHRFRVENMNFSLFIICFVIVLSLTADLLRLTASASKP